MHVLITGGAGFIGSRLAASLDHDVVLFDSLHPQVHRSGVFELPSGVTLHPGDVRDPEAWDRCFLVHGKPDVIVHLAAETGTGQSLTEASRHGTTNVVGTTELTDALVRHGHVPQQILLTSSRAVYGEGTWVTEGGEMFRPGSRSGEQLAAGQWDPLSPDGGSVRPVPHNSGTTWPSPTNVYAATKLAQEHVLDAWCVAYGVPLSILRLQNVYGPGQAVGNAYTGVLTFFARQIASGDQVEVYEDGNIIRDFVFVDDVVGALGGAVMAPPIGTRRVDIGGGRPVSLLEVATTMCELGRAPAPTVNGQFRLGDVRAASADISAAHDELGWTPSTSLRSGLEALLDWVPDQL